MDKKTAEQVYVEIEKLSEEEQKGMDKKRFDEHRQGDKKEDSGEYQKAKEKWNKAFSEGSCYAKQQGNLPKGMERLLDAVLNQKVNWKHLLYRYLTNTLPYDYTYSRPSKKSISTGFYMPSILRENIEVCVSVDTSGSISQKELSEFLGEITGIARTFNNITIRLIVCDCEIHEVYEFGNNDSNDIANIKISGGGGTDHNPVYDYIEKHFPNTKILVNFTDGFTSFPKYEKVKSIWVISKGGCDKSHIPFGEVINLD